MTESAAAEPPRRRAFRCKDGCFHLRWDSLMLSFTPEEFAQLRALLRDAEPPRAQPVPAKDAIPRGVFDETTSQKENRVKPRPATLH